MLKKPRKRLGHMALDPRLIAIKMDRSVWGKDDEDKTAAVSHAVRSTTDDADAQDRRTPTKPFGLSQAAPGNAPVKSESSALLRMMDAAATSLLASSDAPDFDRSGIRPLHEHLSRFIRYAPYMRTDEVEDARRTLDALTRELFLRYAEATDVPREYHVFFAAIFRSHAQLNST